MGTRAKDASWDESIAKVDLIDEIIECLLQDESITTKTSFQKMSNAIYGKYALKQPISTLAFIERYNQMIADGWVVPNPRVQKIFRKRNIRNLSGIAVISLLTKFWGCPGKCIYCPTFPGLPKSYLPDEPAVMRASLNSFDPSRQIHNRLRGLQITGHTIDKCDVRIIGGTWSVYPHEYQEMFIQSIYDAHSSYREMEAFIEDTAIVADKFAEFKIKAGYQIRKSKNLEEAKQRNESVPCRVVGLQIETRPDWITIDEIKRLRAYGVTRVEIGYQTTIDAINTQNKRGHGNKESIEATRLLKDAGFKICAHIMPNLLGSSPEQDRKSMREVFDNQLFRPDEIKIYPMVVTDRSELTEIWKRGEFEAYDDATLIHLMADLHAMIPNYCRLNRMYRDIPAKYILHGSHIANLRQISEDLMKSRGHKPVDICSREVKGKENDPSKAKLVIRDYQASDGHEYMLSIEDPEDETLFSLLRLRIPSQYFTQEKHFLPVLQDAALIREIHTYGEQLAIGTSGDSLSSQHRGFGKRLLQEAEDIIRKNYPDISKLAIIAGVGVREYFRKLGYTREEEYMIKFLQR